MIHREQFVSKYADLNKNSILEAEMLDLETFVDTELLKSENIISMINQDQINQNHNEIINNAIENQRQIKESCLLIF